MTTTLDTPEAKSVLKLLKLHLIEDLAQSQLNCTIGKILGKGSFGVVHEITIKRSGTRSGEKFAAKFMPFNLPNGFTETEFDNEVAVLAKLQKKPLVLTLHHFLKTPSVLNGNIGGTMVTELCQGTYFPLESYGCNKDYNH